MSYISLYRKYRPQMFADMVGQEHITKILKNQIVSSKISHAYIFSGTRGTGKTTAAKVFARAINCLNPKDGEPCNECEACKNILDGNTTDVVEMDAASNNSVENIRSIRQEVAYSTTGLKYKVYIIDEAHMLSTSAFNALLKTLEEPPANVVFILATTEEHKILPTILSRCIRFEFKKISIEDIVKRLEIVLKDFSVKHTQEALISIAQLADGGMRDALSILERCLTTNDTEITEERIQELIGTVPKKLIEELIKGILEYDVKNVDNITEQIINTGKDIRNITSSTTEMLLKILVGLVGNDETQIPDSLKNTCKNISTIRIHEIIKQLAKLDDTLRLSNNVNIIFKAKVLELTTQTTSLEENALLAKINELEMKLDRLEKEGLKVSQVVDMPKVKKQELTNVESKKEVKLAEVKADKKKIKQLDKIMKKTIEMDNLKLYSALAGVNAYEEDGAIVFATENSFAYGVLNKDTSKEDLRKIINEEFNNEYNVRIEYIKEEKKNQKSEFESLIENAGVPFEIID